MFWLPPRSFVVDEKEDELDVERVLIIVKLGPDLHHAQIVVFHNELCEPQVDESSTRINALPMLVVPQRRPFEESGLDSPGYICIQAPVVVDKKTINVRTGLV